MKTFQTIQDIRSFSNSEHLKGKSIGFVPTMGALHEGHLELVRASNKACDITLVSIFVNPEQFNNPEDFEKYPSHISKDVQLLKKAGCDAVFIPSTDEMYDQDLDVSIHLGPITQELEGKFRPGHFEGVGLVVSKLFNITQADKAFFGQKDVQQFYVIKKLVDVLNFPIKLEMVQTKRETSGLAMSSRNERLSVKDREEASLLFRALVTAKEELLANNELHSVKRQVSELFNHSHRLDLEYFEAVDTKNFKPLSEIRDRASTVLCIAAEIDTVRLIDNIPLFS